MKTKILGALLVFALLGGGLVSAQPVISGSYSFSDSSPKAGATVFYYVTVANAGTATAEDVEVAIVKSNFNFANTNGPGKVKLGNIAAGTSKTATFAIRLGSMDFGVERVSSKISYTYNSREYNIENDAYLSVESTQFAVTGLSSTKEPLRPGQVGSLEITLRNEQSAEGKEFRMDLSSGTDPSGTTVFTVLGGSTKYFEGPVGPEEEMTVRYDVYVDSSVTSAVYDATLALEYIGAGIEKSETVSFGILVQGEVELDISSISTDPSEIKEGDEDVKLTFTVNNIGQELVKNLKLAFEPEEPFFLTAISQEEQNLGTLTAGASASASYYVDVAEDISGNAYTLPLILSYLDSKGKDYIQKENVTLRLKQTPVLILDNADLPPGIIQGETVELRLDVRNNGAEDAEGASVRAIEKVEQPFEFEEKSDNIGLLEAGESGQAVIVFTVESDATLKDYGLELEFRYTDGEDVYTKTVVVAVPVSVRAEGDPTALIAIVAVILIAGIVMWKRKGSKGMLSF